MRKTELIAELNKIKGNPEILLWNGYVGDCQHVDKLVESCLVKSTLDNYIERSLLMRRRDEKRNVELTEAEIKELKKQYKQFEYEQNSFVTQADIANNYYKQKRVVYIAAKLRGATSLHRSCGLEY